MGALALAAIALFDLGPNLPSNDDWVFAWAARQLAGGHGLRFLPDQAPLALVQIAWGALTSLGHPSYQGLRLSALPFVVLAPLGVYLSARQLGASPPFATLGAVGLLTSPLFGALATTFMTEPFYVGLMSIAAAAGVRWLTVGKSRLLFLVLATLASLERQHGVGIAIAMTLAVLLTRRRDPGRHRDYACLVALWALTAAGQLALPLTHLGTPTQTGHVLDVAALTPAKVLGPLAFLPAFIGLSLLPFLPGLLRSSSATTARRVPPLALAPGLFALLWCGALMIQGGSILPGDYITPLGLGPVHLAGAKPALWSGRLYLAMELLAIASMVVVFFVRPWRWLPSNIGAGGVFLLLLAASQVAVMFEAGGYDRYYLPVVACLLPLAAVLASRTSAPTTALAWGLALSLVGLVAYAVGEQDYQSWQRARDLVARPLYLRYDRLQIDAGYEANGIYWEVPEYEQTGIIRVTGKAGQTTPAISPPPQTVIQVRFAPPGDPREGLRYDSLSPGRIIVDEYHGSP